VSFYNFDAGQTATITFTINAPWDHETVLYNASRIISTDPAGGTQDQDEVVYFSGSDWNLGRFDDHPNQGYRVRLDVESAGLAGGHKHKTFWLGCPPPEGASSTPAPSEGAPGAQAPPDGTSDAQAPEPDGPVATFPSQDTHQCHVHNGRCRAAP
jgi:hypothetical protein